MVGTADSVLIREVAFRERFRVIFPRVVIPPIILQNGVHDC